MVGEEEEEVGRRHVQVTRIGTEVTAELAFGGSLNFKCPMEE